MQWQSGDCTYMTKSSISDDVFENLHNYYRTAKVELDTTGAGQDPQYLEIHFFPDGSVKGYVTDKESVPMLSLSEDREDRSDPSRCPSDKKPV